MAKRRSIPRVAVIGAGNGGLALAGAAALAGCDVALYDIRPAAVEPVEARGGIGVGGLVEGFGRIRLATIDLGDAIEGAELVIVVVPGRDQAAAIEALSGRIETEQLLLLKPGCTGGALEAAAILRTAGKTQPLIAETDSFLFGCAIAGPAETHITTIKSSFGVAALPARRTEEAVDRINRVFPQAVAADNVLATSFSNMNAVLHVPAMVANAGRVEDGASDFDFYGTGISPSVAHLTEVYDRERLAAADVLGVRPRSLPEWILSNYGVSASSLYETLQILHRDVYGPSAAPRSLKHRYLTEDVPYGAVPTAAIGHAFGIEMPVHRSCITLASVLCGEDFEVTGRSLHRLGLAGLTTDEIRAFVE